MDLMILLWAAPALLPAFTVDPKGLRDEGIQSRNVDDLCMSACQALQKEGIIIIYAALVY